MDSDLERVYNLITTAVCAEDVFGELTDPDHEKTPQQMLEDKFRKLRDVVNPEIYNASPDDKELAWEANERLAKFHDRASSKLADGTYGSPEHAPRLKKCGKLAFRTGKREYYLGEPIAQGTISTVYEGECAVGDEFAGRVAIKIANSSADNDLMWREMTTLKVLHAGNGPQRKHLPVVLDHFKTSDSGRVASVLRYLEESYDLISVRENPRYLQGIHRKDMVWMLSRLLSAIGYAHSHGIVHGNIEPTHLFVRPRDHNLFIIDWSWSAVKPTKTGDIFKICTDDFSAPEVSRRGSPTPSSDLYSIGMCMIYLLGGDVRTKQIPYISEEDDNEVLPGIPERDEKLRRFIGHMVLDGQSQRAQDAWTTFGILRKLIVELWGKRHFRHFLMD